MPTVALAGYTNAGKSTLLNALTGAGVGVGERLFHTLDPTTRAYEHDGRRYLVTDTVGFIRKLPHQLVEAFKATLEETRLADLIVHVVDGSEPEPSARRGDRAPSTRCSRRSAPASSRGCSSSTSSTCSTTTSAATCSSACPDAIGVSAADRGGARRAARRIEARLRGDACARSSCWSPTPTGAAALASSTSSPATSSATSAPTASSSGRGSRRRSRTASSEFSVNGATPSRLARRLELRFQLLGEGARLPTRAHDGDAGPRPATPPRRRRSARRRAGERRHRDRGRDPAGPRRAWCCRARASRRATGSRWSTRPA